MTQPRKIKTVVCGTTNPLDKPSAFSRMPQNQGFIAPPLPTDTMSSINQPPAVSSATQRRQLFDAHKAAKASSKKPPFAGLAVVFMSLLILCFMGTIYTAVKASEISGIFTFIVLFLSVPSLLTYFALYSILNYLSKQ